MLKYLLLVTLVAPVSCAHSPRIVVPSSALVRTDTALLKDALDAEAAIVRALPAYKKDDISRYEVAEIAAVDADIKAMDAESDPLKKAEVSLQLSDDWDTLVALDDALQKEHIA